METTWRDFRLTLRNLRRNPAFTTVAISILALGIGASVAMFSVLHSVVLRLLPYPAARKPRRTSPYLQERPGPARCRPDGSGRSPSVVS